MVKRLLCMGVCLLIFIGAGIFPVLAQEQRVYDDAGLFVAEEERQLEKTIADLRESISLDLVIVTTQSTGGKDAQTYADDFYDAGGFGVGSDYSGVLLLIDMGASEVAISTCGFGIRLLSDARIDTILDCVVEDLSRGNFADAANQFLNRVERYASQYPATEQSSRPVHTKSLARALGMAFPISLGVGGLAVWIVYVSTGKSGKKDARPRSYRHYSFLDLSRKDERLIDKRVITRRIPRQPPPSSMSSGGHSSTHTSSSGRSHGGGSRSFGGSSTRVSSSGRSHGGGSRSFGGSSTRVSSSGRSHGGGSRKF